MTVTAMTAAQRTAPRRAVGRPGGQSPSRRRVHRRRQVRQDVEGVAVLSNADVCINCLCWALSLEPLRDVVCNLLFKAWDGSPPGHCIHLKGAMIVCRSEAGMQHT